MEFLFRKNCEYTLTIFAGNYEQAFIEAQNTPDEDWNQAWSEIEDDRDDGVLRPDR